MTLICLYGNHLECLSNLDLSNSKSIEIGNINNVALSNRSGTEVMWTNGKNELNIYDFNEHKKSKFNLSIISCSTCFNHNNEKIIITDGVKLYLFDRKLEKRLEMISFYESLPNKLRISQIECSFNDDSYFFSDCAQNKFFKIRNNEWKEYTIEKKFKTFLCNPNNKNSFLFGLVDKGYLLLTLNCDTQHTGINDILEYPHKFIKYFPLYCDYILYADTNDSLFVVDSNNGDICRTIDIKINNAELTCLDCNDSQIVCGYSNGLILLIDVRSNVEKRIEVCKSHSISFISFDSSKKSSMPGRIILDTTDDSIGNSLNSNQSSVLSFIGTHNKENISLENTVKIGKPELKTNYRTKRKSEDSSTIRIQHKNECMKKENLLVKSYFNTADSFGNDDSKYTWDKSGNAVNDSNNYQRGTFIDKPVFNISHQSDKIDNSFLLKQIIKRQDSLSNEIAKLSKSTDEKLDKLTEEVGKLKCCVKMENFTTQSVIFEDVIRQLQITESNIYRFMKNFK